MVERSILCHDLELTLQFEVFLAVALLIRIELLFFVMLGLHNLESISGFILLLKVFWSAR